LNLTGLWKYDKFPNNWYQSFCSGVSDAKEENIGIKKFNNTYFGYWKMQIEDILYGKDLHQHLLGEQPNDMYDSECDLLDRKALTIISVSILYWLHSG
jgi:hypothetical protein